MSDLSPSFLLLVHNDLQITHELIVLFLIVYHFKDSSLQIFESLSLCQHPLPFGNLISVIIYTLHHTNLITPY